MSSTKSCISCLYSRSTKWPTQSKRNTISGVFSEDSGEDEATSEVSEDDQDELWTDQGSDFAVLIFALQPAINLDVPHDTLSVNSFFSFYW